MDSSRHRSQSRAGQSYKKLRNASRITDSSVSNEIINENDAADEEARCLGTDRTEISDDTSNSKFYSDPTSNMAFTKQSVSGESSPASITSCKPCSVMLQRLSEESVQKLLLKSNFKAKNVKKKKSRKKQPLVATISRCSMRLANGRFMSFKELEAAPNSPMTYGKGFESLPSEGKPNEVKNTDSSDEIVKSRDEFHVNCANEGIKASQHLLCQDTLTSNNSNLNEAGELDHRQTTQSIQDSSATEVNLIGEEYSEIKVLRSKRFRLSLRSNKIHNTKDNETGGRVSRIRMKQPKNMEGVKEDVIDTDDYKSTSLILKQTKPILKKEIDGTETADDPCSKLTQTQDINEITSQELSSYDSEIKASRRKRFTLPLRKEKNDTKDDVACRRDPPGKDLQLKDSEEMIDSSVLDLNHLRRLIKRRQDGSEQDGISVRKLKKLRGKQDLPNHDNSNKDELDSFPSNSCVPRSSDRKPRDPQVLGNRRNKQNVRSKVQDTALIVRNVKVSLEKLDHKTNPSMSGQDDNVKALDYCIERREPVSDCQTQLSETQKKGLGQSSIKSRNTKITDYFFKIDKSSVLSKSNSINPDQVAELLSKKKYGISKDVLVLLVDINKLKLPMSTCSASTRKYYANSSIGIQSPSTTANVLSSSSFPSNKSPSFHELSTNKEQSSTDINNLLSVNVDVEKPSHDSIQTHTIPVAKNLSPMKVYEGLDSPQIKNSLAALYDSKSDEEASTDFTNVSLVNETAVRSPHGVVQIQKVLVSDNVLSRNRKSPRNIQAVPILQNQSYAGCKTTQVKKQSPTKATQDSLNGNIFVNTTPRSRKEKLSLNNFNENLDIIQEVPNEDLSPKNTVELRAKLYSSPTNAKQDENRSSDPLIKNTTPRSSKTLNLQLRKLTLSPEGRIVLFNNEIPSNKPQIHVTDFNGKAPRTVGTVSDVSPDGNKLQKQTDDKTPVLSEDSNTIKYELSTHPAPVSVIKSLRHMGISQTHSKQVGPRHLPANSMTILSREMIQQNSSWMELYNTIQDLNQDRATAALDHTMEENALLALEPSQNTRKEKTTSCNTTTNADDNCIGDSNPVGNSSLIKTLIPQNIDNVSSKHSGGTNNSDIAVRKINCIQGRNSVLEAETSAANIPGLIPTQSVDEIDPVSVARVDQESENPNAQEELASNSEQEGQLLIDMDRSDSESLSAEDTGASSSNCLNSSLGAVVQDEDACTKTPVSSEKVCVICKRTFKNILGLESHLRTHITVTHTTSRCHICNKRVGKKNTIEHYLQHCVSTKDGQFGLHSCSICQLKFRKKSSLLGHTKSKHSAGKYRIQSKVVPTSENYNKCTICQVTYNSKEDLFSHVLKHTSQELQDAFAVEKAKLDLKLGKTTVVQDQGSGTPKEKKTQDKQKSAESTKANDTLPTSTPPVANCEISICICHKDERLEMSRDVIIEIALTCMECKTLFKTKKCFEDHYNSTSCKWSDKTVVTPSMFCNKCCTILNNLQDMHGHLTKHGDIDVDMQTSMFCKHCNIFFYGIGSLFYAHWSEHRKNPLFLAEHYAFPKNTRLKVIDLGGPEPAEKVQPMKSLFIADHQCQKCEKPFHSEDELKRHVKSCSKNVDSQFQVIENPKPVFKLICSMCNKEFIDKTTFDSHIEEHVSITDLLQVPKILKKSLENNQLTCSICKIEYDTITSYKEHFKRHEVIQEKFLCNYCTLMIDSVEDFERHSVEHRGTLEKPVSCKVIFAINKFHCKVCKIWLDNQSVLDEHLATHNNSLTCTTKLIENSTNETAPAIEKQIYNCVKCQQEFDDQLKLDAHAATHNIGLLGHSTEDPILIHVSDDSNSTDIEIIADKSKEASEEPVAEDILCKEQRETVNIQEPKKPAFLRVKNLKELLPYSCNKCKAEFDTPVNLSNHMCLPDVNHTQNKGFSYFCTICKSYPCNNDADWNLHILSHFPLKCSQKFSETWYHVRKMQCGQQIFKCKVCPNYDSLTIHTMRRHFISTHPNIYHPIFQCRVCHSFKTAMEQEVRRHESAHFQQPSSLQSSPLQPSVNFANKLLSTISVENSNNCQQPVVIPPETRSCDNRSLPKPVENFNNSYQPDLLRSVIDNLPPRQSAGNSNKFQQTALNPSVIRVGSNSSSLQRMNIFTNSEQLGSVLQLDNKSANTQQNDPTVPINKLGNNLPLIQPMASLNNIELSTQIHQPDDNSNDLQRSGSTPIVSNAGSKLPALQLINSSNNFQQRPWIEPAVSSTNNLTLLKPQRSFNKSQEPVQTFEPDSDPSNFQLSIPIPAVTNAGSNLLLIEPAKNSNKFQQSVTVPPVTSLSNNLQLKCFINAQQPGATYQSDNNSTKVEQVISIPPVTSASTSSASLQSISNPEWLTKTAPTFQLQINGASPFNNMTNMMHTLPLYVANVIYCCRICKVYKCSSEQELKAHESLHEHIQLGETSKGLFRCKLCPNIFCLTENQLRAHMDVFHIADKSNVSQNQKQFDIVDSQSKCKYCSQTFTSSIQLMQHVHTAHTSISNQQPNETRFQDSYPYPCQICSIDFLNEAFLIAHMRQIHPNVKLPRQKTDDSKNLYKCDTCGLLLISEATLSYHMRSHDTRYH